MKQSELTEMRVLLDADREQAKEAETEFPREIKTREELIDHLQIAMVLEHATIPAYLTAMYSIKDMDNSDAALVIRSVVVEEMLHLTLAGNVMNAVGGEPALNVKGFVPSYPTRLPHSSNRFEVNLERFCEHSISTFMRIEHPAEGPDPQPQPNEYKTIGQFYSAIMVGIDNLCANPEVGEKELFNGDRKRQVTAEQYYGSGGRLITVQDKKSAFSAINEIIEQGEGASGKIKEEYKSGEKKGWQIGAFPNRKFSSSRDQAAHYYRFDSIRRGRYYMPGDKPGYPTGARLWMDWDAVWPARINTRAADFPDSSPIRVALDNFNRDYKKFLNVLHDAFNGKPALIADTIPLMYDLKYKTQAIMRIPIPGSEETVGPSWEWVPD